MLNNKKYWKDRKNNEIIESIFKNI